MNNMVKIFFSSKADVSILNCPADGNIYMLWSRLKEDESETNVVDVLKEMSMVAKERLGNLRASDFSEIYLFFDYDGHNDNIPKEFRNKDILGEMLETFNNETELGKLYVSYPMIESIKEVDTQTRDYKKLYLPLDEASEYKGSFCSQSDYNNYNGIDKTHWLIACDASRKRASLFPRAMSQAAALARIFGECREGQIPRPLGRKEQVRPCPVACCRVFD